MWRTGLVAPRHVGSSQTRARTRVPCIGRRILNNCAIREALPWLFFSGRSGTPGWGRYLRVSPCSVRSPQGSPALLPEPAGLSVWRPTGRLGPDVAEALVLTHSVCSVPRPACTFPLLSLCTWAPPSAGRAAGRRVRVHQKSSGKPSGGAGLWR